MPGRTPRRAMSYALHGETPSQAATSGTVTSSGMAATPAGRLMCVVFVAFRCALVDFMLSILRPVGVE